MNTKIPFQFKVLRYIHDSFTGEFLNVGLALYSRPGPSSQLRPYLKVRLLTKHARITNTFPSADGDYYRRYIASLQTKFDFLAESVNSKQISFESWPPNNLDDLLTRVLPPDDSAIQFGPLHGGMAGNLDKVFDDLYYRLIETYIPADERLSRSEQEIWSLFSRPLHAQHVTNLLSSTIIRAEKDDVELAHAWKNGRWKALQPISFDLQHAGSIQRKAHQWLGTSVILDESSEVARVYYLLGKPRRDEASVQKAYRKAKDLLGTSKYASKIEVIEEDAAEDFAATIGPLIRSDVEHSE